MRKRLGNRPERQRSNVKWRSTQRTMKEVKWSQAKSQSHIFTHLHRSSLQTNLALCDFLTFPSQRPYASNAAFNGSWWLFWWLWPFIIHTDQMYHTSENSSSTFHPPFSQLLTFKSIFSRFEPIYQLTISTSLYFNFPSHEKRCRVLMFCVMSFNSGQKAQTFEKANAYALKSPWLPLRCATWSRSERSPRKPKPKGKEASASAT